jgi:CheY-like chemotaxis protein
MESSMAQANILVADDSRTVRTVVSRTLSAAGFDVTLACDGEEAVLLAEKQLPDLAILDIQMPGMDGYTACEKILDLCGEGIELPIVFLTKEMASHLPALGAELGAYLPKPVNDKALLSTVYDLLDGEVASNNLAGTCK